MVVRLIHRLHILLICVGRSGMHCYRAKHVAGIDFVYSAAIFAEVLCESKV